MIELYHSNWSICAQKVRLVLAEKGIEAVEHHLDLRASDQQSPEYLKINPKGYVPTLVHDGRSVIESAVICEYLVEVLSRHGSPGSRRGGTSRSPSATTLTRATPS